MMARFRSKEQYIVPVKGPQTVMEERVNISAGFQEEITENHGKAQEQIYKMLD